MSELLTLNTLPGLRRELVDALDALYPEKCPDIQDTERGIWMYAGQRQLVRNLKTIFERQERHARNAPILGGGPADRLAGL